MSYPVAWSAISNGLTYVIGLLKENKDEGVKGVKDKKKKMFEEIIAIKKYLLKTHLKSQIQESQ